MAQFETESGLEVTQMFDSDFNSAIPFAKEPDAGEEYGREIPEDGDHAETPGITDTHDPVRSYLREMGTVRLLKREGEVALAQRIERGERLALRAISRSPFAVKELLSFAEELCAEKRSAE